MKRTLEFLIVMSMLVALLAIAAPAHACNYGVAGGEVVFSQTLPVVQTYSVQQFSMPVYAQQFNVGYSQRFVQQQRFYPQQFRQRQVVRQRVVGGYGGGLNIRVGGW